MAALNQRLALSGLLAFAASILIVTEQTAGDSAVALNSESTNLSEFNSDFDMEDVG